MELISGFELTYRHSGNTIDFSFFTMQIFPSSLKITVLKQYKKENRVFSLTEKQKLFCIYH